MFPEVLDEEAADRLLLQTLQRNYHKLCLTPRGYAIIIKYGINNKGENSMPHKLFKDNDGTIRVIVESDVVTLDDIEKEINEVTDTLQALNVMRDNFLELEGQAAAQPAQPNEPIVSGEPAPALPQANADQGQAPANSAIDAPVLPTAAVNNGQADPAASSNPTPVVGTPTPGFDAAGNPLPPAQTIGADQPVINS